MAWNGRERSGHDTIQVRRRCELAAYRKEWDAKRDCIIVQGTAFEAEPTQWRMQDKGIATSQVRTQDKNSHLTSLVEECGYNIGAQ